VKPDERELLRRMQAEGRITYWDPEEGAFSHEGKWPRDLGAELGMHPKRLAYLCRKWEHKGWMEGGVCVDLGWLTKAGKEVKVKEGEPMNEEVERQIVDYRAEAQRAAAEQCATCPHLLAAIEREARRDPARLSFEALAVTKHGRLAKGCTARGEHAWVPRLHKGDRCCCGAEAFEAFEPTEQTVVTGPPIEAVKEWLGPLMAALPTEE